MFRDRLPRPSLAAAVIAAVLTPAAGWAQTTPLAGNGTAGAVGLEPETEILPGFGQTSSPATTAGFSDAELGLPEFLREGFATAMGQSLYLPAAALLIGVVATFFFVRPAHQTVPPQVVDPHAVGADAGRSDSVPGSTA